MKIKNLFNKSKNKYEKSKESQLYSDVIYNAEDNFLILFSFTDDLFNEAKTMSKRGDQCKGLLMISELWYKHFKDGKKVLDCINRAKKIADVSLTNPHNLILSVLS